MGNGGKNHRPAGTPQHRLPHPSPFSTDGSHKPSKQLPVISDPCSWLFWPLNTDHWPLNPQTTALVVTSDLAHASRPQTEFPSITPSALRFDETGVKGERALVPCGVV